MLDRDSLYLPNLLLLGKKQLHNNFYTELTFIILRSILRSRYVLGQADLLPCSCLLFYLLRVHEKSVLKAHYNPFTTLVR